MDLRDILGGGQYGEAAGALLARKRKQDRRGFQDALKASVALNFFGNLKANQEQDYLKDIEELNSEFTKLSKGNKSIYDQRNQDRLEVERYNRDGEIYLNEVAKTKFNNHPWATNNNIFWEEKSEYGDAVQKKMNAYLEQIKAAEKERLETLLIDPAITAKTFDEYNEPLYEEFNAKLRQLEDDPTKLSFFKKGLNKLFGYGAAEIAELDNAVKISKARRVERDKFIDLVQSELKETMNQIDFSQPIDGVEMGSKVFKKSKYKPNFQSISSEANNLSSSLKKGEYEDFSIGLLVDGEIKEGKMSLGTDAFGLDGDIKVVNKNGEVIENVSPEFAIAQDAAMLGDYLFQRHQELYGRSPEDEVPVARRNFINQALQWLGKSGRFRREGGVGGFFTTDNYYPLAGADNFSSIKANIAEDILDIENPVLDMISAEYQYKDVMDAPSSDEVVEESIRMEREDLLQEYGQLLKRPEFDEPTQDRIREIEQELSITSEALLPGNDQLYNKAFLKLIFSPNPPFERVRIGDRTLNVSLLTEPQKRGFYNAYLSDYQIEKDEELEKLLGL